MSRKGTYKYCIVPCCISSTAKTPEKIFFNVPRDSVRRKAWTNAMKRDEKLNKELSSTTPLWCCEDHFLLAEDMENYWQWKLTNNIKQYILKPNVIPHIFECQLKRPVAVERSAVKKRKNMHIVQEAMSSYSCNQTPSTSNIPEFPPNSSEMCVITQEVGDPDIHKSIQVNLNLKKPYRSKGTNTFVEMTSVGCSTSNMGVNVGTSISPEKFQQSLYSVDNDSSSSDFNVTDESESSDFSSESEDVEQANYKKHMLVGTVLSIEKEPKLYLGITKKSFYLIKLLSEETSLPINHIYLVLKKIRLNLQFSILAMDFGLTTSTACRIFSKSLPLIASSMRDLIVMPDKNAVQAHLPISFRARYGHLISIIDCFEIEVEKPSNPVSQALTWSAYYNCNTIKYLISCTPDGLVTFISEGFGGRASDLLIVQNSGFLNNLVPGTAVMADRGFKNISHLLQQKNCNLIRPPSVSAATKSSKHEVKETKRIAAVRIHVERLIRRVREFKMLAPHVCVDRQHIPLLDLIVIIVCGIINMQDQLIK
ncbi:unnamed protein product [Larinioides sclopetarius]|uniref:THAP-type domain-containing protein n=1 Tax=Larinioides sclopetarius TaxID=280406 RepID=A0AAV1Z8D0_9ARAC